MRTPSGSRRDLSISSHRDDVDDELDGDPKLRAMRAVWLSMRDEDPPERGLAELMAAARGAAATMRGPTLWQRLVAGLRRPPALALATVVVLVGGAVIVGRRNAAGELPEPPPASSAAVAADPPAPSKEATPDLRAAGAEAERGGLAAGLEKPEPALERHGTKDDARKAERMDKPKPLGDGKPRGYGPPPPVSVVAHPDPGSTADTVAPVGTADVDTSAAGDEVSGPRRADTPPPGRVYAVAPHRPGPAPAREHVGQSDDRGGAPGASADPASPPPPYDEELEATKQADLAASTEPGRDKQKAAPAVPLEQLYQQCESAARRGDCAAVRRMVDRIKKSDRGYRARVAKDAAVAKCLDE